MHREVLHCDPSKSLELAAGGGEIHFFGGRISQTAEEIKLFLTVESAPVLAERKVVAVRPGLLCHGVFVRSDTDLLEHFAAQSVFRCLALIDTALRQLPTFGKVRSLADKHPTVRALEDGGDVRAVAFRHD